MADPAEARDDVRESIEKELAVVIREKDLLAEFPQLVRWSCREALVSIDLLHCKTLIPAFLALNLSLGANPLVDLLHKTLVAQKPLIPDIIVGRRVPGPLSFRHKP